MGTAMENLTDLHCHILPYVDDGAENLAEALEMLRMEQQQGVRTVVLTPHSRTGMFETGAAEILRQFDRLKTLAAETEGCERLTLLLGREYHCDAAFARRLAAGGVMTLGAGSALLMEFSSRHSAQDVFSYVAAAAQAGYQPVIAHVERYPCIRQQPENARALVQAGVWLQINASSVLGQEGWQQKRLCRWLMREDLVRFVGSDAHHIDYRPPNLGACARYVEKKMGAAYAQRIFHRHPAQSIAMAQTGEEST
jgi:protein-tyrosine phosphatase